MTIPKPLAAAPTSAHRPRGLIGLLRAAALQLQHVIARSELASRAYLAVVSALCRNVLGERLSRHVEVLAVHAGVRWPELTFAPRSVTLGTATRIKLVPHLGEFDQAALFRRRIDYEAEVFHWLEREAARRYDTVIEIGANVGIYSVFLDRLIRSAPGCRLSTVASFEPSPEAYRRLIANLAANAATHVQPFNAAVAESAGFRRFYEPRGHLTNGSLVEGFADHFTSEVDTRTVATHAASGLDTFFAGQAKVLIKIDVEGYEPELLAAMGGLIERRRPDLIVEILPGFEQPIARLPWLASYTPSLVTREGPQPRASLIADARYRDWLLTPTEAR